MDKCTSFKLDSQGVPHYFKFAELIKTSTGIINFPQNSDQLACLARLWYVLNRLRHKFGSAIYVNSAYRTPDLNRKVGGAENSYHLYGRAADIRTLPHLMDDFRKFLNEFNEQHQGAFVEFIDYGTFFHIAI